MTRLNDDLKHKYETELGQFNSAKEQECVEQAERIAEL